MLSVEDEENIKSPDNFRMRLEFEVSLFSIHHVNEVFDISEILVWRNYRLSYSVSVTSSGDGRSTTKDSVDMEVPLLCVLVDVSANVGWVTLRIERAHAGNKSGHHTHRVSIMSELLYEGF